MRIELDWIQFECIRTECAFFQSKSDPDWSGSRNCAWEPKRVCHVCSCRLPTVSTLLRATHSVPHICSTQEATWWLAEVKIWQGCHGTCSYVEAWPLEVNVHTWIWFRTMQCGCDRCALDSHWILIGQLGYWTNLNLDSVWTGLRIQSGPT